MSPVKAVFALAALACAAVAAPLLAPSRAGLGVAIAAGMVLLLAAGLLAQALRAAQRAELGRRQQTLRQLEAARAALGERLVQASTRGGVALDAAREVQLALQQARESLEQLRAALPQRALARSMERARARATIEKAAQAIGEPLEALVAHSAEVDRRAAEAVAALGEARRLGEALQVVVINARLALESGRGDDQLAAADALERMSEAACALLARAPDAPAQAQQSADVAGKSVAAIELALAQAQAQPGSSEAGDDDAVLEQALNELGRNLGNILLQSQATVRAAAAAAAAAGECGDSDSAVQA